MKKQLLCLYDLIPVTDLQNQLKGYSLCIRCKGS